ncbi:hypothetical protein [Salinarchaeum laminariae]|uniref:hypothetical protein n=1 Tax=Salinarchaeum laminariae TaxID=869888 RepID=UPI0020BFE6EA|nr:hypothetical protein [Salinarchaeum laminariae]
MTWDLPSGARLQGLREQDFDILVPIAGWFCEASFPFGEGERAIGTHYEPSIEALCESLNYTLDHDAFERLRERGYLETQFICRRQVEWVPTQHARDVINEFMVHTGDTVELKPADPDRSGFLRGWENESLLHRKGVATVRATMEADSSLRDSDAPIEEYSVREGRRRQDLCFRTVDTMDDMGVEVVTSTDSVNDFIDKWQDFLDIPGFTVWIFDSRQTACRMFNELHREDVFQLAGGLCREPSTWNSTAMNEKLRRSWCDRDSGSASPLMNTITAVFEADGNKIDEVVNTPSADD